MKKKLTLQKVDFYKITFSILCLCCSILFPNLVSFGQIQENGMPVFISTSKAISSTPELSNLLHNLQPTIFINEDHVNKYGDGNFQIIECAPSKISQLYEKNPLYASVKVIKIKINSPEEIWTINLSDLVSFDNLVYIQIIYTYDICGNEIDTCLSALLQNRIIGARPLSILYEVSIGR